MSTQQSLSNHNRSKASLAIYAGTFDPITLGHVDIIKRGLTLFDKLVVAISDNPIKPLLFSVEERKALTEKVLVEFQSRIEIITFSSLLVDLMKSLNTNIVIRGLRAVSDYEYEGQMAMMNRRLMPEIETVFLMTSNHYSFVSSSIVKNIAQHTEDFSDTKLYELAPAEVVKALAVKYHKVIPI